MKAYAIKDPKGKIIIYSVGALKSISRDRMTMLWKNRTWKYYYNRGYRCVPVTITEVKTSK